MKLITILTLCFVNSIYCYSQNEGKPVLGVAEFTKEVDSKYASAVAEKVVEVVTNSKRFIVVDRTSLEKVKSELELQKSEAFLDSKNTVKQDALEKAQYLIVGHVVKMSIYAMKNGDGSTNGYKASAAFTLKVNHVETGKTTEAEDFQTSVSPLMLSPESAVNESLKSIEPALMQYFRKTFPLSSRVVKILNIKKESASTLLIAGGKAYGFNMNDELIIEKNEMIEGKNYPSTIGKIKVINVAGDDFSECDVLEGGKEILSSFNTGGKLTCKLIVK